MKNNNTQSNDNYNKRNIKKKIHTNMANINNRDQLQPHKKCLNKLKKRYTHNTKSQYAQLPTTHEMFMINWSCLFFFHELKFILSDWFSMHFIH